MPKVARTRLTNIARRWLSDRGGSLLAGLAIVLGLLALAFLYLALTSGSADKAAFATASGTMALAAAGVMGVVYNRAVIQVAREDLVARQATELERRRERQVLQLRPLALAGPPRSIPPTAGPPLAEVVVAAPASYPLLHLTVTLRAMADAPDPGSSDGKAAVSHGLGSWFGPRGSGSTIENPSTYFDLGPFLRPLTFEARDSPWEVRVQYLGPLGQQVVESYEWWFNDITTKPHLGWQMRRFEVSFEDLPGAEPLVLTFGDD